MIDITARIVSAPVVKPLDRVEISLSLVDAHILRGLMDFRGTIPDAIKNSNDSEWLLDYHPELRTLINEGSLDIWMAGFRYAL